MDFKGLDYYNVDELLTDEEKMLRTAIRGFLSDEVELLVRDAVHEEKPLNMHELAPKMAKMGIIGAFLPEEYGCPGASYMDFGLIAQELERVDTSIRSFVAVESALFMYPVWQFGTEEQKRKWLPQIAAGQKISCFGLTEPEYGSDVADMNTVARKDGGSWVINGAKQWISEASTADVALVFAHTDDGPRMFLVEQGTEGFTQTFLSKKGSSRAADVGELLFSDCRVPDENRLPGVTRLRHVFTTLNQARYGISWGALGAAMDCYETALNYARERKQFGSLIASYQLVQERLVEMLVEITKGQLLSYRLGRLMDEGKARPQQISLAKKNNVAMARMCARTARELLGANGVSLEYSPMRHMQNIESVYTYQGTDHIHTLILGQDITGISAFTR